MKTLGTAALAAVLLTASAFPSQAQNIVVWRAIIGIAQAGKSRRRYHRRRAALVGARGRGLSRAGQRLCRVFEVRGLVLAGGNTIGTPGAVNQVKGTLVCGPGSASPTVIDTALVPLDAQGNAEFSGSFSSSTAGCSAMDVAFLVRTAGGAWIGNGAVRLP